MGDSKYQHPVALTWSQGPQKLNELKNKLQLYFGSKSKSDGGDCEIRDTDCTRGYVLIYYKEEKDRDRVLQKDTHELKLPGGKIMKLDIWSPGVDGGRRNEEPPAVSKVDLTPQSPAAKAPSNQSHVTQEPQTSLILIENLQDSYSSEMLNLLVENISGMNGDTDFQVERIPEKQCAIITFTCDIDILRIVKGFSRNSKIWTCKMTAKPLEETRTIRVEGLPPNTPEDYIGLYFENPKHGVPGSTEDTMAIPEEGAALVTFSTVEAAKKVLGKKHWFSKTEVSVYPYYPEQDFVLYGDQRPQIQAPEPLTLSVSKVDLTPQSPAAEAQSNQSHVTQEPQTSLILIENLPNSYSSEMLNLLVENISGMNEDTDFQVERIPEKQCAIITFTCDIDILRIVEKFSSNSKIRTCKMKIKPLEETKKVRVEGLPPNTPEDYISLYFENPKHGVPGSMEDTMAIPEEGAALVTFSTVEAAKKVLGKKHRFSKTEVSVYPYYPEQDIVLYGDQRPQIQAPEPLTFPVSKVDLTPQSPAASLILIENLQDSYSSEMLNLLVENISGMNGDTDFQVERIPEKQSAIITFTCDIDILRIVEKFSRNSKIRTCKMKVKPLEETRTIRVEGLPPNTPEDYIGLYFENPKHGVPGSTEDTMAIPEEGAALVTFSTVEAAKKVLGKKHRFSNTEVSVYPYYPEQDIVLYGDQRPQIRTPEPLTFPVSPYILEFILSNNQFKDSMVKTMRTRTCEIKWPDLVCPNPVITLCFPEAQSTDPRTLVKLVPTWKDEVQLEFSRLISKYKFEEYKIHQSVWDAVKEHASSSTYNGVLIKPELGSSKVFLVGMVRDVDRTDPTFRQLVEETTKQVERTSHSMTETIPMSSVFYQIMCNSGLKKKILDQVPELKMDYDVSRKAIQLSGLRDEVLTAKCEILNIKQEMKSKSIQMNQHLVQFLMSTDNEELSSLLFVRHKINAMLEIEDNAVQLTAYLREDLTEAEEQMNRELICREVPVEEISTLKIPEWGSFQSHLLESYNAEKITVLILESNSGAENNVVIAGLSSNVGICYQKVSDFLENTPMNIKVKSMVVMQFLKEEKKQVLDGLKNDNLSVVICNKIIHLRGPSRHVAEAHSHISNVLSSLCSDTLTIDKPGAKKFCLANEEIYITMAKNTYRCLIRLQKEEEEEEPEEEEPEEMEGSQCQIKLPNGMVISVHKDDLCRHRADVIVNAANEDLKHVGGLALTLLKAAGPTLQDDSDHIVKTEGRLSAGESVITDSGRLPCKQVIHTVGPRWNSEPPGKRERLLQKAITSSLELAEEYCHTSIAIPAVSCGSFGCPVDQSAENIIKAIKQYAESKPKGKSTLKEIRLVDTNVDTIRIFSSTLKSKFGKEESEPPPKYRVNRTERVERPVPSERVYESRVSANQMMTKENIYIKVREGFIQDAATDAIVNSVGKDLFLSSGGASRALLNKAGDKLQKCLKDVSSGVQVKEGSMFITEGCNLKCKTVIHVVVPAWDGGHGSSEKIFRDIVRSCLSESEKKKLRSITFPAIGTGALGFPKRTAASFMFEEILKFSSKSNSQHLREVNFILHPNDKETLVEFSKELNSRMDRNVAVSIERDMSAPGTSQSSNASAGGGSVVYGTVSTPTSGTHEMRIGSVTYQVKTGDITKEDTDIIVNSTDRSFTMRSGVSKAILDAAGQSVVDECTRLGFQVNKEHIVTQNGNLRCKKILHKVGTNSASGIKTFITEALTECARLQATSVAFPAIGTGMGNVSASEVADSILESVANFARSPQSVRMVKVVIFQKQMLNDFHASMKKKEGGSLSKQEGFFTKMKKCLEDPKVFELRENIEPVCFQLCAESQRAVDKTKVWLRDLIMKEQYENIITEDWIQEFDEKEREALLQLQKTYQVSLIIDLRNFTVKVLGLSRDVLEVSNKIQDMIKNVRDKKTREREAELCSNLVEWGYLSGSNFTPFDKMTNMELEKAKTEDRQSIHIDINGAKYTVIVELLSARDPRGNTLKLQRNSKHGKLDVPQHWAPVNNDNLKVVPLSTSSQEFMDVDAQFKKTCQMRIIKIERIQNRHLWINYQIKKQSIDDKNGSTTNEKQLFHGLDSNTVNSLNHNGFNRSYAGKNAACYGNGTYFAVNASYSAHDTYSHPDGNGYKYMYLARVVTGVSSVGKQGMIAPPPKNPANPTDLYDSVTDNPANPAMYVIFHDIQAYPEYLITFTT